MLAKDKAFNAFIEHLMANKGTCCYAPANRYCAKGKALKEAYNKALREGYYDFQRNKQQQSKTRRP